MKKTLFTFAIATLILGGCNNTEELDKSIAQTQKEIGFSTIVNKETRALTNSNFNAFWVYGSYTTETNTTPVIVFNSVKVSGTVGGNWTYGDTKRYWINGANYVFDAYSCDGAALAGHGTATYNTESGNGNLILSKVIINKDYQHDLVYSKANDGGIIVGKETQNEKVNFVFKHILSKVIVTFKNAYPQGYNIQVSNVNIENPRFRGTWNGSKWEGQNRKMTDDPEEQVQTIKIPMSIPQTLITTEAGHETLATSEIFVLPHSYTVPAIQLNFDITVTNENGTEVLKTSLKASLQPNWEPGKAYNYTAELKGDNSGLEAIEFTTSGFGSGDSNGWEDGTGGTFVLGSSFQPEGE